MVRVTQDTEAGAAYILLLVGIKPGEASRNVPRCGGKIVLDFNDAGQLIGIELLDLRMLHPNLARAADEHEEFRANPAFFAEISLEAWRKLSRAP